MNTWTVRTIHGADITVETTADGHVQITASGSVTANRSEVEHLRVTLGAALIAIGGNRS